MQITILVILLIVAILLVANFIATINGNNNLYKINNLLDEIKNNTAAIYNRNIAIGEYIQKMHENICDYIKEIYIKDKNGNNDDKTPIKDECYLKAKFSFLKELTDEQKKCINKMLELNIKLLTAKINNYINNELTAQQKTEKCNKANNSDKNNNKSNNKSNNKNNDNKSKNKSNKN